MKLAEWDHLLDGVEPGQISLNTNTVALLKRLRAEVVDWQEAMCGEREGLDELCAEIDEHLGIPPMPREWDE